MDTFDTVKVFSATKYKDRDELGSRATEWLRAEGRAFRITDCKVLQSSDSEYHCLTLVFFGQNRRQRQHNTDGLPARTSAGEGADTD